MTREDDERAESHRKAVEKHRQWASRAGDVETRFARVHRRLAQYGVDAHYTPTGSSLVNLTLEECEHLADLLDAKEGTP